MSGDCGDWTKWLIFKGVTLDGFGEWWVCAPTLARIPAKRFKTGAEALAAYAAGDRK